MVTVMPDGRIAVAPQNVPDLQPLHVLHGVGSQGLAVLGQELPEEIPLADCTDIFPIPADDGDGGIAVVPHLFQSLTEGAVIVQIGDAVLWGAENKQCSLCCLISKGGGPPVFGLSGLLIKVYRKCLGNW